MIHKLSLKERFLSLSYFWQFAIVHFVLAGILSLIPLGEGIESPAGTLLIIDFPVYALYVIGDYTFLMPLHELGISEDVIAFFFLFILGSLLWGIVGSLMMPFIKWLKATGRLLKAGGVIVLLVALGVGYIVWKHSAVTVYVVNEADAPLHEIVIGTPGHTKAVGSLAAHAQQAVRLPNFPSENEIVLAFSLRGKAYQVQDGYIEDNG